MIKLSENQCILTNFIAEWLILETAELVNFDPEIDRLCHMLVKIIAQGRSQSKLTSKRRLEFTDIKRHLHGFSIN